MRKKALLMVSVVFVAGTCSKRVDFEAVMHNMYLLPTVSRARKMSSERTGSSIVCSLRRYGVGPPITRMSSSFFAALV
jgi:hypothetical protein